MKVRLKKEQHIQVNSSEDIYKVMQVIYLRERKLYTRNKERFWVVGLNKDSSIEYIELVAVGKLNSVSVEPTDVFSFALQKKCAYVVLVHNHPNEEIRPSIQDKHFTIHMKKVSLIVKIPILDHLIIGENKYYSFADNKKI